MVYLNKSSEEDLQKKIALAAKWIAECKKLVVFTGAGISTESGLPDFRGPDGVWTRRDKGLPPPKSPAWHTVDPNKAHMAILELQKIGKLGFLISQNVDNLHLKSGILLEKIAELHGNTTLMVCLNCNKKMTHEEAGWDKRIFGPGYRTSSVHPHQPNCPNCGGRLISSIVNFGDPLPQKDLEDSFYHSSTCDVFFVVGSSLVVTPAAHMPVYAMRNKAKVILLNMGETPFDGQVDLRFWGKAGEIVPKIVQGVKKNLGL